jgi:DNA replication and repair protein RecF
MRADWLQLSGFRSYQELEWKPDPGVNILIGQNGAGKTNLLEAIGYMSWLRSFRSVTDQDLIADDRDIAIIRAGVVEAERDRRVEIELRRTGPRRALVDGNSIRRTADMLEVARVVTFLPDDLDLVKRGPAYRRDLIDDLAAQLWPASVLDRSEYERALRQRNAFLRAGERDEATLSVWDSRLAQSGGRVLARRARSLQTVAPLLETAYEEISSSGQKARITYRPTWGSGDLDNRAAAEYTEEIITALESTRRIDRDRRLTTVGPHRDEPGFSIDDVDARTHGSQGEQRSVSLAIRLASHRAITETTDRSPILLLDDVFSELDPGRSEALAASLPDRTQTMITSARPEDVPVVGAKWQVEEGGVHEG